MAFVSELFKKTLRLTGARNKVLMTISKINPSAAPADIAEFVSGVNGLRAEPAERTFVLTENELSED